MTFISSLTVFSNFYTINVYYFCNKNKRVFCLCLWHFDNAPW